MIQDVTNPPRTPRAGVLEILLPAIFAAVFAVVQIRYSMAHGRLAMTPYYDDITYLRDGTQRLASFYQDGIWGLVKGYAAHPPHSPFSSFAALIGYLLFGIRDWAPYSINALVVFTLLMFAAQTLHRVGLPARAAMCVLLLTIPLSADMIAEFRPDFACGLAAAIAVVIPLRRSLLQATLAYRLSAGLWFAIALLCKTSAFPLTMMTVGLAWVLSAMCDRLALGREATAKKFIALWLQLLLPMAVLALPLYLIDLRGIVSYIWINIFSARREHWAVAGTPWFHASYYFLGEAGQFVLNRHLFLLPLPIIACLVLLCIRSRESARNLRQLQRAIALILVGLLALAVPTLNVVKSPFFGAESQTLLVLGSVMSVATLLGGSLGLFGQRIGIGLLAVMSVAGICLFQFPKSQAGTCDPHTMAVNRVVRSISGIVNQTPEHGNVLMTCWGLSLNADTLTYLAAQNGKQLKVSSLPDNDDLAADAVAMENADCVVAAEPLVWEFFGNLPTYDHLAQSLDLIRRNENFSLTGSVPSEGGPKYFVFHRLPDFTDWESVQGLGEVEGPYPQWNLPKVRWGMGNASILRFTAAAGGTYRLNIAASAPMDGQVVSYLIDGKPIERRGDVFAYGVLRSCSLHFDVDAGEHEITLKYAKFQTDVPAAQKGEALLYRTLRLSRETKM